MRAPNALVNSGLGGAALRSRPAAGALRGRSKARWRVCWPEVQLAAKTARGRLCLRRQGEPRDSRRRGSAVPAAARRGEVRWRVLRLAEGDHSSESLGLGSVAAWRAAYAPPPASVAPCRGRRGRSGPGAAVAVDGDLDLADQKREDGADLCPEEEQEIEELRESKHLDLLRAALLSATTAGTVGLSRESVRRRLPWTELSDGDEHGGSPGEAERRRRGSTAALPA